MPVEFDYEKQAWIVDGKYVRCGHDSACNCYGKLHEGETATEVKIFAPMTTPDGSNSVQLQRPMTADEQEISDELGEIFG